MKVYPSISRLASIASVLAAVSLAPVPALSGLAEQLSSYSGANAKGYLEPLAEGLCSDLCAGIFRLGSIESSKLYLHLELQAAGVLFSDADRTFYAITEGAFEPTQRAKAPTVVGPTGAVTVEGEGGTRFSFPGGFDIGSFTLLFPQLRIGALAGSEFLARYLVVRLGEKDLGKIDLFGVGVRHSLSRYMGEKLPVDISASLFWQRLLLGEDERENAIFSARALSFGLQAGRKISNSFFPYCALSYERRTVNVTYVKDSSNSREEVHINFSDLDNVALSLGFLLDVSVLNIFAEYYVSSSSAFVFGLAIGCGT